MSAHPIHHVTAVTAQIADNLEFYTQVLGLRLVKRSVNQDDVSAYHLFYADSVGSPGTDMTFFDWPKIGPNVPGAGSIALTSFRVPSGTLEWWESRLAIAGAAPTRHADSVLFADAEGQRLELVADEAPTNAKPWSSVVPEDKAIRGILGVDLCSLRPDSTRRVLAEVLGFETNDNRTYTAIGSDTIARLRIVEPLEERRGHVGAGGVHHVAFRVPNDEELYKIQAQVEKMGMATSGYVDRFYFHSLYFREPGGILFEIATDGPGFASDEPMESLGDHLALPPFLEPHREKIEAGLKPLPV